VRLDSDFHLNLDSLGDPISYVAKDMCYNNKQQQK